MSKRFTDNEKWKKTWFRKLSPIHKCFWFYLCDNCNHAGIWEADFELAEMFIGCKLNIDELKKTFEKQYNELRDGKKWFIKDFIDFQYGELNPINRAHNSVINILNKEGAYKPLKRPLQGRKDMDKDKDKDKVKDKGPIWFNEIWEEYPKPFGKKIAFKHFTATVETDQEFINIKKALNNYKLHIENNNIEEKYIKHGSTWFNNWQEWVDYKPKEANIVKIG